MKRIIGIFILVNMFLLLLIPFTVLANVSDFDNKIELVKEKINEVEKDILDLSKKKKDNSNIKRDIEDEIIRKEQVIELTEKEIKKKEDELITLQKDIISLYEDIDRIGIIISDREEDLKGRVKSIYSGDREISWLDILFSSESFSSLISNISNYKKIVDNDKKVINEYASITNELEDKKEEVIEKLKDLEDRVTDLNNMRIEMELSQGELNELRYQKEKDLVTVSDILDSKINLLNQFKEDLSKLEEEKKEWERLEKERAEKERLEREKMNREIKAKVLSEDTFITPTEGWISSLFGPRWGGTHRGLDIATPVGSPVYVSADGEVTFVGYLGTYGNLIKVEHEIDGVRYETRYAHLNAFNVEVGQLVSQGDLIALSGNTGNSTGPHIHFEIIEEDDAQDPLLYINID